MSQMTARSPDGDVNWLVDAMSRMVRPVVRFSVGRISCSALVDLVRLTYVQEARAYLQAQNPDRKVTRSALALLCGMDGRAIKTFEDSANRDYVASDVCSEASILDRWTTDETFLDPDSGEPAELLIHGPHATFQRLVTRAAGRAVTVQTALEKLLDSGNVELSEDDTRVRLLDPFYQPVRPSERTTIEASSLAMSRLGRAVMHNIDRYGNNQPPWLQQDRWSTRIPSQRVDEIRTEVRSLLERHIREFEDYLGGEEDPPSEPEQCLVGVGWYYWEQCPESSWPGASSPKP
ncbi:hypothetical protein [Wenzhouxiangella marina]|uniref:Uncharacterized protein n=1 Tax=Wenzhouxiangella marina TaxID=1579979 RepID=A0A0K0XZK1_9GAMM|nr:hypothetical protein [Wenzhouxiangella marina]AKS43100.1 hypothetical protein WM2015_2743 [Wenzhouxiangella marina]MBB6087215.1 hypothetical protein [Wenzhouxiangella marina]